MPLRACALLPYKNVSDRCKTHVRWGEFSVYRFDIYISFFILFLFLFYSMREQSRMMEEDLLFGTNLLTHLVASILCLTTVNICIGYDFSKHVRTQFK